MYKRQEGITAGEDPPAELELAERYHEVGLTWWIVKLGWFRGPLAAMRARVEAGPPRP